MLYDNTSTTHTNFTRQNFNLYMICKVINIQIYLFTLTCTQMSQSHSHAPKCLNHTHMHPNVSITLTCTQMSQSHSHSLVRQHTHTINSSIVHTFNRLYGEII